jgi:hypothetical protein
MMVTRSRLYQDGVDVSQYKPVLVHMDERDWDAFREFYCRGERSARVRELIRQEVEALTRDEVKAQSLAGLTEA